MKKIVGVAAITGLLSGCAWSAEGLGRAKIEDTYTSIKPAAEVAGCVSSRLMGSNPAFQEGEGHWVVVRNNGYGIPIVRFDIMQQPDGGSKIEFRRSVAIMSGEKKAESCF
ncbi:MAG TPA: hypothetical protein VMA55_14495 [Acidovorax sp.]|nr:hypothetical protein [Acidovorax sp.]